MSRNIRENKRDTEILTIKNDIEIIKEQIIEINKNIQKLSTSCKNMDNHITFIDNVYSNLKSPINFIIEKIGLLSGSRETYMLNDKGIDHGIEYEID